MRPVRPDTRRVTPAPDSDFLWSHQPKVFRPRRLGDWFVLVLFALIPLATGADVWYELGWRSQVGRAIGVAFAFIAVAWAWLFYTLKLAVRVTVSREGLGVLQGPRRRYMLWSDVSRLLERAHVSALPGGRCLIAQAHDGRRLQVAEAAVAEYARFRAAVYAAYRDWRDHAAALDGDVGSPRDPYLAHELPGASRWLREAAVALALPALYLGVFTPAARVAGVALAVCSAAALALSMRAWMHQRTYLVDAHGIEVRTRPGSMRLTWDTITRNERQRRQPRLTARAADFLVHTLRTMAGRPDPWTGGSRWPLSAPDVLLLGGAGRRVQIRLDRLPQPEALAARIERHLGATQQRRRAAPITRPTAPRAARPTQPIAPPPATSASQPTRSDMPATALTTPALSIVPPSGPPPASPPAN